MKSRLLVRAEAGFYYIILYLGLLHNNGDFVIL